MTILTVTNLNDSGAGSLRDAVTVSGKRRIEFAVSGTIELNAPIVIDNNQITIDGHNAPNGGICLKNYGITCNASDVIIRHIRIRRGDTPIVAGESGDCLLVTGGSHIWIDHVSLSFSIDELFNFWGTSYATISHSLLALALDTTVNGVAGHSAAILCGNGAHHLSFYNVLMVHCAGRVPLMGGVDVCQYVNCYHYNTRNSCIAWDAGTDPDFAQYRSEIIGNGRKNGPNTNMAGDAISRYGLALWSAKCNVYQRGNLCDKRPTDDLDETLGLYPSGAEYTLTESGFGYPALAERSAGDALTFMLRDVGATLPKRDALDAAVIANVINGTGAIIDDPTEVGGWPDLTI